MAISANRRWIWVSASALLVCSLLACVASAWLAPQGCLGMALFRFQYSHASDKQAALASFAKRIDDHDAGRGVGPEAAAYLAERFRTHPEEQEAVVGFCVNRAALTGREGGVAARVGEPFVRRLFGHMDSYTPAEKEGALRLVEEARLGRELGKVFLPRIGMVDDVVARYRAWYSGPGAWDEKRKINPLPGDDDTSWTAP
jgi:hypothetical protein